MSHAAAGARAVAIKRHNKAKSAQVHAAYNQKLTNERRKTDWFIQNTTFEKFDVSNSGQLEEPEVRQLITQYNEGSEPTDDEVKFVMKRADKNESGGLTKDEISLALAQWRAYEVCKPRVVQLFAVYDKDKSGRLDIEQSRNLLTDLNEGPITEEEFQQILDYADVLKDGTLSFPECSLAVAKLFAGKKEVKKKSSMCQIL